MTTSEKQLAAARAREKIERNDAILRLALEGMKQKQIAILFGISQQRVSWLVASTAERQGAS